MNKIVTLTFILSLTGLLNFKAVAQDFPDFEAELQALENNQIKAEELQMRNVDAVTGVIDEVVSDEVATGQAGVLKKSSTDTDTDETIMMTKEQKERVRRIRSRPL